MTTPDCKLTLDLVPSRQLIGVVLAGHLLAAFCLLLVDIAWHWRTAGWCLVALHAAYAWWDSRWLCNLQQLIYSEGRFEVIESNGCQASDAAAYIVTPWLVILKLSLADRRRLLPLFRDSCDPDDLRRLRVLLRVQAAQQEPSR